MHRTSRINTSKTRNTFFESKRENVRRSANETKNMSTLIDEPGASSGGLTLCPPEWKGAHALRLVRELNERCIESLVQFAHSKPLKTGIEIVDQHRALWRKLDLIARRRTAAAPFLLMDAQFLNVEWWKWARAHRSGRLRAVGTSRLPAKLASDLMRETLILAWSTASTDPHTAALLFGMSPAVVRLFSELGPHDIEQVAARHRQQLRLRWEEHPTYWRSLLTAAQLADVEALHELHLYSLQLLGSELLSSVG